MGNARIKPENPDALFLPFQAAWVKDPARLKLFEKSRQIGISWATAYATDERTAMQGARHDQWVSSRDELQARLFIEDCRLFAKALDTAAEYLGEVVIDRDRAISAHVIQFANGRRIHSMSSNPDAQAGKRGGRVLDEFALHPDPRKLYSIAYPGITWGGQFEVISTHRGSANLFNVLIQEIIHKGNPKGFSHHRVTLQDALDQGFLWKLQSVLPADDERQGMDEAAYFDFIRAGCADEEQFAQEYMCVPADDASAFLTYEEITACEYPLDVQWEMTPGGQSPAGGRCGDLYVGVDVGRSQDLTVIWVLEKMAGIFLTRRVICLERTRFAAQEAILYEILGLPMVRRCCIDSTGLGMQFAERAQEKFGPGRVEAVRFTGPVKEELAYPVRAAFEDRTIRIPNDDKIRSDLRSIRKTTTAAGNIRFDGERNADGHADRFWALALAIHAGKHPAPYPEIRSAGRRGRGYSGFQPSVDFRGY